MMPTDEEAADKQLLTYTLADRFGFDNLFTGLSLNIPPLYLYAATFVFLDFGVINTYFHVFLGRTHGFIQNPFSLAIPAAVLIAAIGTRYMTVNYRRALDQMSLWERSDRAAQTDYTDFTISLRTRIALYVAILGIYYVYGKLEAKASPFRAGMKPTNRIQPPKMA